MDEDKSPGEDDRIVAVWTEHDLEGLRRLREPFPASAVGKLPRGGTTLDYVGHAAVTDRLLEVDPLWNWEPAAFTEAGLPRIVMDGNQAVLWIKLTICGVTRLGVGICNASAFELEKQLISDALRNAAMRFGVALDLWSKEPLHDVDVSEDPRRTGSATRPASKAVLDDIVAKAKLLDEGGNASMRAFKEAIGLGSVSDANEDQAAAMLAHLDHILEAMAHSEPEVTQPELPEPDDPGSPA